MKGILKKTAKSSKRCDLCPPLCEKELYERKLILAGEYRKEHELMPANTLLFSTGSMDPLDPDTSGNEVNIEEVAKILNDQSNGKGLIVHGDCHCIPSVIKLISQLKIKVPIVWSGQPWLSEHAIKLLKPITDSYLFSIPYFEDVCAAHIGEKMAYRGAVMNVLKRVCKKNEVIIHIPVKPTHLECDARPLLGWIAENTPNVIVRLIPHNKQITTSRAPELNNPISIKDFNSVVAYAHELGLKT